MSGQRAEARMAAIPARHDRAPRRERDRTLDACSTYVEITSAVRKIVFPKRAREPARLFSPEWIRP